MNMAATKHANLWAALVAAHADFKPVVKDKQAVIKTTRGGEYRYNYADLGNVLDAVSDALCKHGVVIYQAPTILGDGLVLISKLVHGDTGESVDDMLPLPRSADMQQLGSAISYTRRYLLMAQLGIAAEDDDGQAAEDDDGQAASSAENANPSQRTTQTRKAQQRPQNQAPEKEGDKAAPVGDKCQQFAAYVSKLHAGNDKKCSKPMYEYLVGLIDGITRQDSHKPILSKLTGEETNSGNVPNWDAARYLLDILVPENTDKETGDSAPNEKYSEAAVNCIRKMWDDIMEDVG